MPPSLEESFRASPVVLADSGLKVHEDKSVRNSAHFLALGMEVRGAIPETGADRLRRFALAQLSQQVARTRRASRRFAAALNSSWTFCLEAR